MLTTVNYYLYYNASHGITLLLKKHSFVSNIGFYYQKKKFKVFFGATVFSIRL